MIGRLAIVVLLLAQAFAVATFAEFLAASYSGSEHHAVAAWAFGLTALAGFGVPRFIEGFDMAPRPAYALTGLAGLIVIYGLTRITVNGDFAVWQLGWIGDFLRDSQATAERGGHAIMGALLLLVTWALGTRLASDEVEMETIPRSVTLPFAVVTIIVVLGAAGDRSGEVGRAGAAFYAMAIMALVFSQLAMSGATFGEVRAGSSAGILLGAAAGVAVLGLLVIGLFVSVLGPTLGPIISGTIEWTLTIILTPFAWLLTHLFELLFRGASPLPDVQQAVSTRSQEAGHPASDPSTASRVGVFFMRSVALVVLIGVAALVATVFARLRNRRRTILDDDRQTSGAGDLRSDLGALFRSLLRRSPSVPPGTATTEATRLYLDVLAKAEQSGRGRPEGDTAREFAPVLNQAFANPVTDDITRAFESARYAGREPDERTIAELRQRWQREAN
ncbi:MAG: DUF4129 domain-containing protein [bacterium]